MKFHGLERLLLHLHQPITWQYLLLLGESSTNEQFNKTMRLSFFSHPRKQAVIGYEQKNRDNSTKIVAPVLKKSCTRGQRYLTTMVKRHTYLSKLSHVDKANKPNVIGFAIIKLPVIVLHRLLKRRRRSQYLKRARIRLKMYLKKKKQLKLSMALRSPQLNKKTKYPNFFSNTKHRDLLYKGSKLKRTITQSYRL